MRRTLLLFPGVTEARFFPYLSLPLLTSWLRSHGVPTEQRDLNISLTKRLIEQPAVAAALTRDGARFGDRPERFEYRRMLYEHVDDYREALGEAAFGNDHRRYPWDVAEQMVRNTIDAVLDESALVRQPRRIDDAVAHARLRPAPDDIGSAIQGALVDEALSDVRPDIVGISVAFFSQLAPALHIAAQIRRCHPGVVTVLGGQQVMLRGAELASVPGIFELVDVICTGPGEMTLLRLAEGDVADGLLPDAITPAGRGPDGGHHLRANPCPEFDGLPVDAYLMDAPQLPVISCVGCYWGRCVFCSYGNRSLGGHYQQLTARRLAEWCADGLDRTGVGRITFVDENSNLRLLLKTARLLKAEGRRFEWSTRNRLEPQLAELDFCRDLAEAGCTLMSVGYETSSQRLLDRMDKGVDAHLYQVIVDNLHSVGIRLRFSIMGGLFDETEEESEASRQFLLRNADRIGIDVIQMLVVEPMTRLADDPARFDLALVGDGSLARNEEFSYLGGRAGPAFSYVVGDDRPARAARLATLATSVHPMKNDAVHPRFRRAPREPERIDALQLAQWVSWAPLPEGRTRIVDLCWRVAYEVALPVRASAATAVVSSGSHPDGKRILGRLIEAGLGERTEDGVA